MNISIFGLGYVGCVSAACLAREGHHVVGVDVNPTKVEMINAGKSPIVETGLAEILTEVTGVEPKLRATTDSYDAIANTDISLICVGTPSEDNGSLDLAYVKRCAQEIGEGLKNKDTYHVVVARSTMLPGSVYELIVPEIEAASGKKSGIDFGAAINPEFLRESTSIQDFYNPAVTVIGEHDKRSGDVVANLYTFLDAPLVRTDIRSAEMVKYANNAFHGLKVAFANEIGAICKAQGIDSHRVMDIFCMDSKLNLSSYYLKPGFAFGGSCLPKDLRALTHRAKRLDVDIPVLDSVLHSNRIHVERAVSEIVRSGHRRVSILGLSFKAGTDDLRESPMVTLTETLIGKGYDIKIFDSNVALARLFGANKEYIEKQIPHISSLMTNDLDEVVNHGDVIVIGNKSEEFDQALTVQRENTMVLDLVRLNGRSSESGDGYVGICW